MAKLIISRDAQVIQELELGDGRVSIGRHPDSDIVFDHQAVSGRHAAITHGAGETMLEDLDSSNGTFVNGVRITRVRLTDRDCVAVAPFQLEYLAGASLLQTARAPDLVGRIEVLNGASAGKMLALLKPLTTLGSPGVLVVAITRQDGGYYIAHVKGSGLARINDEEVSRIPRLLGDGDTLEVTGTCMRFSTTA